MADSTTSSRTAFLRNKIADYLRVGSNFELMGTGFTKLDESPSAQTDSTTYINEVTSSTDVTGYETEFSYESDMIASQKAVWALYKVGRDHLIGADAQFEYVRVELFNPAATAVSGSTKYTARKFLVACESSDVEGDGGEKIQCSGTLHAIGDPVIGYFDVSSKTFTEDATAAGIYDTAASSGS